ncbi:hypothetical protein K4K61_000041 [Colletotrichum sp. SAR11_59]|nr:hypothetical protein K4K61_000041 [Colletotrichum sp. SAR11_59]
MQIAKIALFLFAAIGVAANPVDIDDASGIDAGVSGGEDMNTFLTYTGKCTRGRNYKEDTCKFKGQKGKTTIVRCPRFANQRVSFDSLSSTQVRELNSPDILAFSSSALGMALHSLLETNVRALQEHLRDDVRSDHQEMRLKMAELYCGFSALENNNVWDPVLGGMNPDLSYSDSILLFPYRSRDNMLRIFGCFSNSVCKADNGLFLPPSVSRAIEEGVLAIVLDLGMEPPSKISQTELFESHFDEWMNKVQDYQLIVINEAHPLVHDTCKITTKYGVVERELGSLHGHKLKFKTSMRPRVSFVWWSFLSAALVASWRCLRNYEHTTHAALTKSQVEKAIRYWGKSTVNLLEAKIFIGFLLAMGVTERESYTQNRDDLGVAIVAIERAYPMQNPH